jgi:hypothetical protein
MGEGRVHAHETESYELRLQILSKRVIFLLVLRKIWKEIKVRQLMCRDRPCHSAVWYIDSLFA